jgi:hypothetical protein
LLETLFRHLRLGIGHYKYLKITFCTF